MAKDSYYLTAAIPYVNARPHLGHVLEWFQADAVARYQRLLGKKVAFASGTDENSLKNVQAAEKAGVPIQKWLDDYAQIFRDTYDQFNISLTDFGRGSDQHHHWPGVQKLWQLCDAQGDIYQQEYQGLYCVGCESFYTPAELENGLCPEHLKPPELIKEKNYFFRLSKYESQIKELITSNQLRIVSDQFRNEMLSFIDQGLTDFSISRSVDRARGVGVPIPGDDSQVMYVWFDALTIYMTAVGWGYDEERWQRFWPADLHVIGKGINRFHSIYWIGILLSAGLPLPKSISVHGYITADGQKMSKSLGNVIEPVAAVEQYGLEPVRYYLLKEIPTHSDGDFSHRRFTELYTADLANGLGNLCSRVAKLCEQSGHQFKSITPEFNHHYQQLMADFKLSQAAEWIINQVAQTDQLLSRTKPWQQTSAEQVETLQRTVNQLITIAYHLQPFIPQTAKQILSHFQQPQITALKPLFPRLPAS